METNQINETLECNRCHQVKPLKSFYLRKRTGYRNKSCNTCKSIHRIDILRERMSNYRERHRELTNLTARKSHLKARRERPESFLLYCVKTRANKRGLPFDLTISDIVIPPTCPVLGIPLKINYGGDGPATDNSPSIDRIKPELGYVRGNIQIISKRANTIKSFGTIEEHQKIIEYMRKYS